MHASHADRYLFAAGLLLFGVLNIAFGAFSMPWQPIVGIPLQPELARGAGALLSVCALILFVPRTAAWAAVLATAAFMLLFWIPQVVFLGQLALSHKGLSVGACLPLSEDTAMLCGAVTLTALTARGTALERSWLGSPGLVMTARIGFGLACVVFGLSHFVYADFTAQMIPGFLPFRLALAYITGAGHLLAGLAILSGVMARLAAVLEAVMMSSFVVLVHIPMLVAGPKPEAMQIDWTMLAAAMTLSGSAWIVARSLADKPWAFKAPAVWQSA